MFNFIPLQYYTEVFYFTIFIIVINIALNINKYSGNDLATNAFNKKGALLLLAFVTLYMGLRPISGAYFGDMGSYARYFEHYQDGYSVDIDAGDIVFNYYIKVCSAIMDVHIWFLLTAFIYVGCMYWACKRLLPQYLFIAFLMCITAFSFWTFGTNGIRNGMAISLVFLALSFVKLKKKFLTPNLFAVLLCFLAVGIHKSTILPIFAAGVAVFYTDTRRYIYFWIACIFLSLLLGGFWENFFSNFGFGDKDKFSDYLLNQEYADQFSSTGFRWDFLLYSMVPIVLGWHVVVKRKKWDSFYLLLLNTYIIANAFWILVIRATFSNRFAYLSWFLYPIVLIYPVLKFKLWKKQYSKTGLILFLHFLFTYILWWLKG